MKHSDYNFCNKIVQIPLTYGEERSRGRKYKSSRKPYNQNLRTKKRYFLRRSDNKAPFLHKKNVRRYNPTKTYDSTCRCFICNSPDHLSKTCPNKDQKRYSSKYEEQERVLIVDSVNENILVCDDELNDDESIYSIIETEEIENGDIDYSPIEDELDLVEELAGLKIEMMEQTDNTIKNIKDIGCTNTVFYFAGMEAKKGTMKANSYKNINKEKSIVLKNNLISEESKRNKFMDKISKNNINIPYEFLIPRLSFKTDQMLSCFNKDIKDLIWKKYAERQNKMFLMLQEYFKNIYIGEEKIKGIAIEAHTFPIIHFDGRMIIQPYHQYLIFKANIDL